MRKEDLILINTDKQSIINVNRPRFHIELKFFRTLPWRLLNVTKLAMLVLAPQDTLNSYTHKKNSQ